MMKTLHRLAISLLLIAAICQAEDMEGDLDRVAIKKGDGVLIRLTERDGTRWSVTVIVDSAGRISLPVLLLKPLEIAAEGLTPSALHARISEQLAPRIRRQLSISVEVLPPGLWRERMSISPARKQNTLHRRDPSRPGDFWLPGEMSPFHVAEAKHGEPGKGQSSQQSAGRDSGSGTTLTGTPRQ